MITNCPNCGAPLDTAGHCSYCETNVVPTIDIFRGNAFGYGSIVELNVNVTDPWGKSFTIPLRGHIDRIEISSEPTSLFDNLLVREETRVTFSFEGGIRNDN